MVDRVSLALVSREGFSKDKTRKKHLVIPLRFPLLLVDDSLVDKAATAVNVEAC